MSAEPWDELKETFASLLDLTPAERAERLAVISASNPVRHARLSALFEADARADSILAPFESAASGAQSNVTDASHPSTPVDPLGFLGRTVSHFRVLDVLGSGGMGVVYRAQDERLGRIVALKFPLPQYAADAPAKERFLKEARAASSLDHPNLCTAYESGETETGHPFLAMACYSGETLKARLARVGALPIEEAVDIARALLRGLDAAHAAGVVHRDLKPGNVILTLDGGVKILDFGLAKVRDPAITAPEQRPGTVAYMSPEQLEGIPVDGRSDLWSFGVVLYEMLTGKPAFGKGHDLATVYSILHDEPPVPSRVRPDSPPNCDVVVGRLLRKNPDERFATAAAVLEALSAGTSPRAPARWGATPTARRVRWLAASTLVVVAAIGLVAFSAESRSASKLRALLTPSRVRNTPHVPDAEAQRLFRDGRQWSLLRGRVQIDSAITLFRAATHRDPAYADAWAWLARVSVVKFDLVDPSPDLLVEARIMADRAIGLDSLISDGYLGRAMVLASYGSRASYDSADVAFRRAIALDSASEDAHHYYSLFLVMVGRLEEAIRENQAALVANRLGPPQRSFSGVLLFLKNDRAMARDTLRVAVGISRDFVAPLYYLGIMEADDGDFTAALSHLQQAYKRGPHFPGVRAALAYVDKRVGRNEDMRAMLTLVRRDTLNDRSRIEGALSWAVMGDVDGAYAKLGNENWDLPSVHELIVNPLLKNFRSDPRYQGLAQRIGILP